jgi:hypothetical protein
MKKQLLTMLIIKLLKLDMLRLTQSTDLTEVPACLKKNLLLLLKSGKTSSTITSKESKRPKLRDSTLRLSDFMCSLRSSDLLKTTSWATFTSQMTTGK